MFIILTFCWLLWLVWLNIDLNLIPNVLVALNCSSQLITSYLWVTSNFDILIIIITIYIIIIVYFNDINFVFYSLLTISVSFIRKLSQLAVMFTGQRDLIIELWQAYVYVYLYKYVCEWKSSKPQTKKIGDNLNYV